MYEKLPSFRSVGGVQNGIFYRARDVAEVIVRHLGIPAGSISA
jgi:hypothetical protein